MQDEKLNTLANEMMKSFQKQGLTFREVKTLLIMLTARSEDSKLSIQREMEEQKFKALPF